MHEGGCNVEDGLHEGGCNVADGRPHQIVVMQDHKSNNVSTSATAQWEAPSLSV